MKTRLNYVPFRITVQPAYRQQNTGADDTIPIRSGPGNEGIASEIYHGIKSWRRFPVSFGEGGSPDAESIYVLIDRLPSPFSLLDPRYSTVAKAERCKPSELPGALRELFAHLCELGHARNDVETNAESKGKCA